MSQERDTSSFASASPQSQALCLGTFAAGAVMMPVSMWGFSDWRVAGAWGLAAVGVAAGGAAVKQWKEHARLTAQTSPMIAGVPVSVLPPPPVQMSKPGVPARELNFANPNVVRLLRVVNALSDSLVPIVSEFSYEDDDDAAGALLTYAFQSTQPGYFATEATKNAFDEKLKTPFGDGWRLNFDPEQDVLHASRSSGLPSLVTPEIWKVVTSREEAARNFPKITIAIGVGENGTIRVKPKEVPHREVVGATGGGKSVAVRAELMQYFALGYRVFAVDGKGTDYSPFMRFPNVSAVSTNLQEHVLVIHMVWRLLKQRQRRGTEMSKKGDTSWRETMTPILLVLDEFASVRTNMKATMSPKEVQLVERDLVDILKVGREFRVNVILATQDMKADTVPSDWLDMFKTVQSLGKPSPMVVRKAFPEQIQGEVTRMGGTISTSTPGRALVTVTDKSGKISAELYQAYWSYSPAETISDSLPSDVRENWELFKREVSDKIPQLYPRMWVKLEYPEPVESGGKAGKDSYAELREDGWVNLAAMTVMDLQRLDPIDLEDPATFEYIEANAVNDPLAGAYAGIAPFTDGAKVISDY
ncbi:Type VII secretion system protein EccCa1 (plasmid) [Tsukamurella tyrosinosolvens]|uniref:FtsK domain-containing protein n=1 Tax=Tsukamurella tyrosinosolvens TaxID=57704 RepID=A0A1H4VJ51_TSUTY|nr:type IV secretory system conjugative DNA transfer family protein [Tsukamurella tyrosinosolvens]KXO90963.1 hypothetical protein AXK58_21260 [Tsukamurella tyrosinosolvens]SEC80870.1 hypothetical protein SAMN04489793_3241 [Tsukamurella tyrosinosolvens]VEH90491.1 Type VII secretion system protein EccCa1 [Tsukamurella tyrosinosolvens]